MKIKIDDFFCFNDQRNRVKNSVNGTVKSSKRQFKLPKIENDQSACITESTIDSVQNYPVGSDTERSRNIFDDTEANLQTDVDKSGEIPLTVNPELEKNIITCDLEGYSNQALIPSNEHSLSCSLNIFKSTFGWTINKSISTDNHGQKIVSMLSEESLQTDQIDKITQIQEKVETKNIFMDTDIRYHKDYSVKVPNNKITALTRKLNTTNSFANYDNVIKSWIDETIK